MHKDIRKIRYNFLLENYSFQYKITKIMGIAALFLNLSKFQNRVCIIRHKF